MNIVVYGADGHITMIETIAKTAKNDAPTSLTIQMDLCFPDRSRESGPRDHRLHYSKHHSS
jgi:hypothetical protein